MTTEANQAKPAAAAAAPAAAKPADKPAAAAKPKAEPKPPRFEPTGTIKLLKDKDGKQYGTGEGLINPKRANTKAHTWFANYKDGMTIAQLTEAFTKSGGSMNSNLDWDAKHGFVEYVPPKKA